MSEIYISNLENLDQNRLYKISEHDCVGQGGRTVAFLFEVPKQSLCSCLVVVKLWTIKPCLFPYFFSYTLYFQDSVLQFFSLFCFCRLQIYVYTLKNIPSNCTLDFNLHISISQFQFCKYKNPGPTESRLRYYSILTSGAEVCIGVVG